MKSITLKKLTLENWRAQNRTINFGETTEISGDNGTGKSTVLNAFLWLLTGYDDSDRANFKLFDIKKPQTYENATPASVEAHLVIDQIEYTFRKTAKQGWSRKRGQQEYERKGADDYSFYSDGIEVSATQYKKMIEELIAPVDKLKIMLNLHYFLTLDWKEMRKHLECLVDDVAMTDLKGDYSDIMTDLGKHTTEELKAAYKAKMKPIKASIDSIPITIEALQSNLPDLAEVDKAMEIIKEAKEQIEDIDNSLVGASDFAKPYIEKRNAELKELSDLCTQFAEAKKNYERNFYDQLDKIEDEMRAVDEFNASVDEFNKKIEKGTEAKKKELGKLEDLLVGLQKRHEELTQQNRECKARIFVGEKCAYCGQELPEDKLEEARIRFNEQKEKDHAYIVAQGKANRELLDNTLKNIEELKEEIANPPMPKKYNDKTALHGKINDMERSFIPYEETTEGEMKTALIEEKQANLTVVPQQDNSSLVSTKITLLASIEEASKKLGLKEEYNRQKNKIEALQSDLRDNSAELALLEGKLAKVKEFEEEKAKVISNKVNGMFEYVHVEMTETNKSGDMIPICVVKDKYGVNALVANNASRILCGIDIAMAFQKRYGLQLPLFIDNAESISNGRIPKLQQQTVLLVFKEAPLNVVTF